VDAIAVLVGNSGMSDNTPIYEAFAKAMKTSSIPVLPMLSSLTTAGEKIDTFRTNGSVYFLDEVSMAQAISNIAGKNETQEATASLPGYDKAAIAKVLDGKTDVLSPDDVDAMLAAAGFKLAALETITDKADLPAACEKVGFPMVVKVVGPLHKSDVGGVKVGINNIEEAEAAFDHMMTIKDATGALFQSMISGTEMILGVSREEDFGHLIMFGLGGIYTEVLKDVRFALAPLGPSESMDMVKSIRSFPILEGVRGEEGVCIEQVADNLQRLGLLVTDFPQIKEMDINPLKGVGEGLYAVDARVILD
jgi:acetyltransferase